MAVIGATSEMSYNILKLLQIFRQKLCLVVISLSKNFYLKKFESSNKCPFPSEIILQVHSLSKVFFIYRFNLAFTYYGIVLMTTEMYQGLSESEGSCGGTNETTYWYLSLNKPSSLLIQNIFFHLTDNLMSNKN